MGPDRQQQRARAKRTQAREATQQRVDKQAEEVKAYQDQVAASEAHGPGKRLEQRQRAVVIVAQERKDAQHQHATLAAHASAVGPPKERADRDCRNQTIRTLRPLLRENAHREGETMELDMAREILKWIIVGVGINAVSLLGITALIGYVLVQAKHDTRDISRAMSEINANVLHVATMTRDVATMTREILRRTE